jgi:Skp family chaperone for outer membrane proteins
MKNRERIVIYGALALLATTNLAALYGQGGSRAVAGGAASGDQLGPAGSLTLVDDEQELVLRNASGRLAWSDSEHARAFSVGFVHVGRAVSPLLQAEEYVEEMARLQEEIRKTDEEITQRIGALLEESRDMSPDDPQAPEVQRAYQEMLQELERWRRQGSQRLGLLAAEQIERAYRDFVAAVEVVAERRGIDIVYRFIPTDREFQAANPPTAYIAIRARIAVTYPEGIDITDEVLEELAVP